MRDRRLQNLRQQLLDAGVAFRYVNRLEIELRDHLADLERESLARGRPRTQAVRDAYRRLGSNSAILLAFTQRPELQCWIYRSKTLHRILRVVVRLGLALDRFLHHPVLRTATRFSLAGLAASVVTVSLLLGLSLSLNGPAGFSRADPIFAASLPIDTPRLGRHSPASRVGRGGNGAAAGSIFGVAVTAGSTERPLIVKTGRQGSPSHPQITVPDAPPDILPIVPYAAAIVAELATPSPIEIDSSALLLPETSLASDLMAGYTPDRPLIVDDGDFMPIVKVSPVYPPRAAARGIEGYVVIEYTVTHLGTVSDLVVIESSSPLFERSALQAAAQFKFKPRVVGGESIAVQGVRTIIRFELDV